MRDLLLEGVVLRLFVFRGVPSTLPVRDAVPVAATVGTPVCVRVAVRVVVLIGLGVADTLSAGVEAGVPDGEGVPVHSPDTEVVALGLALPVALGDAVRVRVALGVS